MRELLSKIRVVLAAAIFLVLAGGSLFLVRQLMLPVPEVGRDLPSEIAVAKEEFRSRVATKYVAPMPVSELVSQLRSEGFTIREKYNFAEFKKSSFPCTREMRIHWEADDGIATRITGRYGVTCL